MIDGDSSIVGVNYHAEYLAGLCNGTAELTHNITSTK